MNKAILGKISLVSLFLAMLVAYNNCGGNNYAAMFLDKNSNMGGVVTGNPGGGMLNIGHVAYSMCGRYNECGGSINELQCDLIWRSTTFINLLTSTPIYTIADYNSGALVPSSDNNIIACIRAISEVPCFEIEKEPFDYIPLNSVCQSVLVTNPNTSDQ